MRVRRPLSEPTSHIDLATHRCGGVRHPGLRHARHWLPAVDLGIVDLSRVERSMILATATNGVDLAVKYHRGMVPALLTHARHWSPSAELRIIGLD
eukprot:scaffold21718_cov58-Phaeocystis_antarctica.AAC.3